jgi:hypothetical protein
MPSLNSRLFAVKVGGARPEFGLKIALEWGFSQQNASSPTSC